MTRINSGLSIVANHAFCRNIIYVFLPGLLKSLEEGFLLLVSVFNVFVVFCVELSTRNI